LRYAGPASLLAILCLDAIAQPAYVGARSCSSCHSAYFAKQGASAHAAALSRALDHPLAAALPANQQASRPPAYRFEFARSNKELLFRITDRNDALHLPIEWAFGAGRQAVTFVSRVNQDWYVEHYLSYYPPLKSFAATPGQSEIKPTTLAQAAGLLYKTADPKAGIAGCFECHSTGPVMFTAEGEARPIELGVHCESCHGPGSAHLRDPKSNRLRNPKSLSAAQLNEFCGRCHRPPASGGVKIDWNYSWNVRHQPVYLSESKCFRASRGTLTCLTCHDMHRESGAQKLGDYNARCTACHSTASKPPKPVCLAQKPANCVNCHMPLVSPQTGLRFANHWIGIYGEGAKLHPAARVR
jgi:hypothetical protein